MREFVKAPHNYSEWLEVFDKLKSRQDDDLVLDAIRVGTIEWQPGVSNRFVQSLMDAVSHRLNVAIDRFQRETSRPDMGERILVQSIAALRKELGFLKDCVDIQALPPEDRARCIQLILDKANEIQQSLETSPGVQRNGKTRSIIKKNRVDRI